MVPRQARGSLPRPRRWRRPPDTARGGGARPALAPGRSPISGIAQACWAAPGRSTGCCGAGPAPGPRAAGRVAPGLPDRPEAAPTRAADRQFPPEPDGLWPSVLCGGAVHRAWRHRPGVRAAPPDGAHPARAGRCRLGRLIALMAAELAVLALVAGLIGVALGYVIAAALLPDVAATLRGLYGAMCRATGLRPEWWLSGLASPWLGTLAAGAGALWRLRAAAAGRRSRAPGRALVGRGCRRRGRWRWRWRCRGAGRVGAGAGGGVRMLAALLLRRRRWPCRRWCWRWPALGEGRARGAGGAVVLGRYAPAAAGPVAGADGAFAGAGGQCRRRHHGIELPADLHRLARSAAGGRTLRQLPTRPRRSRLRAWPGARRCRPAGLASTDGRGLARRRFTVRATMPPIATTGRFLRAVPMSGMQAGARRRRADQRAALPARAGLGAMRSRCPGRSACRWLGIYSDYGNPIGQVIGTEALFLLYPEAPRLRFGLRVAPGRSMRCAPICGRFGLPTDRMMVDQARPRRCRWRCSSGPSP
jgi:putative ABC transport system permease protein